MAHRTQFGVAEQCGVDHISPLLTDNGISRSLLIVNRSPLVDGTL
jgi:hypothetical protein